MDKKKLENSNLNNVVKNLEAEMKISEEKLTSIQEVKTIFKFFLFSFVVIILYWKVLPRIKTFETTFIHSSIFSS